MNRKDLDLIEAICALKVINKCFGKRQAAQDFGISVDTLNKYLDNLENEVGYKVLSSNGRGSYVTSRGENLVEKAAAIEQILASLKGDFSDKKDISGEVRVGMPLIISANLLPKDIDEFYVKYPNINVTSIVAMDADINETRISNVDLALTFQTPCSPDLVVIHSKKIEIGFFASPQYLSRYGYPVDLEDLLNNHRIVHKLGSEKYIKGWGECLKRAKHKCYSSNSSLSLYEVLHNGIGVGLMPLRFKDEGMVCLDNIKCESNVVFYLVTHANSKNIPKVRAVLNYYKELMDNM